MIIRHRKEFSIGLALTAGFLLVLFFMFTENFGGQNAFHASDALFNSISKGSTYYIPAVREKAESFRGQPFEVVVFEGQSGMVESVAALLRRNDIRAEKADTGLRISGDLGAFMLAAIADADAMFRNDGAVLRARYARDERGVMLLWWRTLAEVKTALDGQKKFAPASFISKQVINRAVEVGYNFYGIEAQTIGENAGIVIFALVFYVVYTLWWGYAIFFLFEGFGLEMKAGKKKEM